jgi:hypothetical protein
MQRSLQNVVGSGQVSGRSLSLVYTEPGQEVIWSIFLVYNCLGLDVALSINEAHNRGVV